jgi:cyclophilin family peptidyl-prolyl cis-trans isomerase
MPWSALCVLSVLGGQTPVRVVAQAQSPLALRLAILQAEDRRAPSANDLAIIRAGVHSDNAQTVRIAVRALGRLERPSLIADIAPALHHAMPEVRVEAATAIGQAAQGWKRDKIGAPPAGLDAAAASLAARLKVDADADVRATVCEAIGRLPYTTAAQAERAETVLVEAATRAESVVDRLGVAKAFEVFVRTHRSLRPPSDAARAVLRRLATPLTGDPVTGTRIRRLALEALIAAGAVDDDIVATASKDVDPQVRRLAMRAAAARGQTGASDNAVGAALRDDSPIVRLEALRTLRAQNSPAVCDASTAAVADGNIHVALLAIDQLAGCPASAEGVALLDHLAADRAAIEAPRGWHRAAHALTALAAASPERGAQALAVLGAPRIWQVRMYAARAAATLRDRAALERFAADDDDNVREAAVNGLRTVAGHDGDAVYISQLTRGGNQVLRAAALALDGTTHPESAAPALKSALQRLVAEGRDNSHDARDAIAKALAGVSAEAARSNTNSTNAHTGPSSAKIVHNDLNVDDLRRLASPRALVTIRDVGTFELALFTAQAPATVLRFARLAASGYYDGLTFHRVVPNFVIQGGSPGANEYVGDATFMRDELGAWPHVRGAVGISTRGRDTGDAQIFVDLVDNPRLDHDYTVFAQVLNGIDVVDQIVEGDVIEKVEILPR